MKVVLYMAMSADGFIAGAGDETPWSKAEWTAFAAFVRSCDTVLVGRRTYEIMRQQDEFVDGPEYIVATSGASLDTGNLRRLCITSKADLPRAAKLGVIGGGDLNGRLAQLGAIDEVILDVEPIVLGSGTRLFGTHHVRLNLALQASRRIGPHTIQNHYTVQ